MRSMESGESRERRLTRTVVADAREVAFELLEGKG